MRAVVYTGPRERLDVRSIALPVPGPTEMLVQVDRCGTCGSDVHGTSAGPVDNAVVRHFLDRYIPGVTVLGHEFAGRVVRVGADVTRFDTGDRVASMAIAGCGACPLCRAGRIYHCDMKRSIMGGFAEFALADQSSAVIVSASLPGASAALIEPLAAGSHIANVAGVSQGARVLILGNGTMANATAYFAKERGADSVTTTSRKSQPRILEEFGVDACLPPDRDLAERYLDDNGQPPDIVIECSGGDGMLQIALDAIRPRGRVVVAGLSFSMDSLLAVVGLVKEVDMRFAIAYEMSDFTNVIRILEAGELQPHRLVGRTVSLTEFPDAFEQLRRGEIVGKVHLAVDLGDAT